MLTAVIIDDEKDAIEGLSILLSKFIETNVKIVASANDLSSGISIINRFKPEIVFLDIDMPGNIGIKIYDTFPTPPFHIIFTTAHPQYAIEAIKHNAIDYLLKPINFIELGDALKRVKHEKEQIENKIELENRVEHTKPSGIQGTKIVFPVSEGFEIVDTSDIEYCTADQVYSIITFYSGRKLTISKSLKELQEMLPDTQFYRTHKSYLINIHYITKFNKAKESYVTMRSNTKVPVSVRNVSGFRNDIQNLLNR